jgi:hypothetical protein
VRTEGPFSHSPIGNERSTSDRKCYIVFVKQNTNG